MIIAVSHGRRSKPKTKIDPLRRCIFMVHAHAARGTAAHRFPLSVGASRSYGVTASTLDSESSDRGSNPRRTLYWRAFVAQAAGQQGPWPRPCSSACHSPLNRFRGGLVDGAPHVYRFRATHDDTPAETPPVLRLVLALWWPGPGVGWGVVWRHGWSEICSYGVPRGPLPHSPVCRGFLFLVGMGPSLSRIIPRPPCWALWGRSWPQTLQRHPPETADPRSAIV